MALLWPLDPETLRSLEALLADLRPERTRLAKMIANVDAVIAFCEDELRERPYQAKHLRTARVMIRSGRSRYYDRPGQPPDGAGE